MKHGEAICIDRKWKCRAGKDLTIQKLEEDSAQLSAQVELPGNCWQTVADLEVSEV